MSDHDTGRMSRAAASLLAIVVTFGVLPVALMRIAGARFGSTNPLHQIGLPRSWNLDELSAILGEPLRDQTVVNALIRTSLSVIWVSLAIIAVSVILETVHMTRHRGMPTPHVRGLGWAQGVGRWIAVGIIAVLPIGTNTVATATSLVSPSLISLSAHEPATTTTLAPRDPAPTITGHSTRAGVADRAVTTTGVDRWSSPSPSDADRPSDTTASPAHRHVVQRGESVFGIATTIAASDGRSAIGLADAILDLNLDTRMNDGQRFINPALIQPGWELVLPDDVRTIPRPVDTDRDTDLAVDRSDGSHVVVEGDTLSEIAADHLGDADAWPRLWEMNGGTEMSDGRTFDDPDLILPGWSITTTTTPADSPVDDEGPGSDRPTAHDSAQPDDRPAEPSSTPLPTTAPTTAPTTNGAPEASAPAPSSTDQASPIDSIPISTAPANTVPIGTAPPNTAPPNTAPASTAPASTAPARTTSSVPVVVDGGADSSFGSGEPTRGAPSLLRLEHAALLATGILTLVGVRRRRAMRAALPHARVPPPAASVAATERRLRSLDDGERAARVDVAVRALAHRLAAGHSDGAKDARIGSVRVGRDGHLLVRLTDSAALTSPWLQGDDDRSWVLPASVAVEEISEDACRSGDPCPALVAMGLDVDERDVLVDLEAAGLTAIEIHGEREVECGNEIVRSIATGLASSLACEVGHLVVCELGVDALLDHPNGRRAPSVSDALDIALDATGTMASSGRTTFDLRTRRTGGEMWEPAVMLFTSEDDAVTHLEVERLPAPGRGIATVAVCRPGELSTAVLRLRAEPGRWTLDGFGETITLQPLGLSPDDVTAIGEVLEHASTTPVIEPLPEHVTNPLATPLAEQSTDTTVEAALESGRAVANGHVVHEADTRHIVEPALEVCDHFAPRPHEVVVRLMGEVDVVDVAGVSGRFERSKTIELIAWLATHRNRPTRTAARTALWEFDVRDATFANVVSEARRGLGRLVDPPDGEEWVARTLSESLPLHELVVTDVDLIRDRLAHARLAPAPHAIDVLRPAVEMITGIPFAGTSYLWPDADGLMSDLVLLAITATTELATHGLTVGDTDLVFWATGRGLAVLPGHEELIGVRMRAHAGAGDLAGVRHEWESYERVITADSWSDGEPAPKLLDLRRELLSPNA